MELTDAQNQAVSMAAKLATSPQPLIGLLAGYAGTGKTTSIKAIAELVGEVLIITPTGKAALRVNEATGLSAKTIHRWMYKPREDENGRTYFVRKHWEELERPESNLIIVEEASMLGRELFEDILHTALQIECSILLVGDAFQLPPVEKEGEGGFTVFDPSFALDGRVMLTEIMRQAQDNPIIRASMLIRKGQPAEAMKMMPKVPHEELAKTVDWLTENDGVTICWRNVTRHGLNTQVRQLRGYDYELVENEPLLILKNNYDIGRFNGEVVPFRGWSKISSKEFELFNKFTNTKATSRYGLARIGEGTRGFLIEGQVHGRLEGFHYKSLNYPIRSAAKDMKVDPELFPLVQANFGYALTCHKSQGSEWKRVLVCLEKGINLGAEEGLRWLYTAITRAKETVALYQGY